MFRAEAPGGAIGTGVEKPRIVHRARARTRLAMSGILVLLVLACSETGTISVDLNQGRVSVADAVLAVVSGNAQDGVVASFLPEPVILAVTDPVGAPIPGAVVRFSFAQGTGVAGNGPGAPSTSVDVTTDLDGFAIARWQLGPTSGSQDASASIQQPGGPIPNTGTGAGQAVSLVANGREGPPAVILVSPQVVNLNVGDSIQLLTQIRDAFGNVLDSAAVAWTSSNPTMVDITTAGVARGLAPGVSTITATSFQAVVQVTVTVIDLTANNAPVALISTPSQNVNVTVGAPLGFTGGASDSDGTIVAHAWAFGDGRTSAAQNPGTRSYPAAGTYTVTYTVTDDDGAVSPAASRVITVVAAANSPPTATITAPNQNVTVTLGTAVTFQGTASDTDGTIASYAWTFGDGGTSTARLPGARTYAALGVYSVTFQATDDDGAVSQVASRTVTIVAAPNLPPTASITSPSSNLSVVLGTAVNFQGTATDTDGTIASHAWAYGNGTTSTLADPGNYTYPSIGVYTVSYQSTDDDGATSPAANRTVTVTSVAPPPPPPGGPRTFLWTSDWAAATGNSLSAIQASGQWTDRSCVGGAGQLIRVVNTAATLPNPPAHWPTNVLQVDHNGEQCDNVIVENRWPAPAVGDTIWFRLLTWLNKCGLNTGPVHNVQSNIGSIAWIITEDQCQGGSVPVGFKSYFLGGGLPWAGQNIADSTYLRYEWGLIRESTTRYDALVRVYDDRTGALIFDENTLRRDTGQLLAAYNATSGFTYSGVGPDITFRSWMLGQQGPGLSTGQRTGAYYYAGAAVCNPGPCGPYTRGEGP